MSHKRRIAWGAAAAAILAAGTWGARSPGAAESKSAADLEKEKAMQSPYPNDLGPERIDDVVKGYPKKYKKGYELLLAKCARCHSSARPLHSRFVEPDTDKAKKEATVSSWKKSNPELFKSPAVWQIEAGVWERYVKRMKQKPGCDLAGPEAKAIWEFLVYDSNKRKIGANAKSWEAHRKNLLEQFKAKFPKRYEELEKNKDL